MKHRLPALAIAGALAVAAAAGYLVGTDRGSRALAEDPAASPAPATPLTGAGLSGAQRAEVEAIIRNYLLANPEIIRDAMEELQRRQDAAEQVAQSQVIGESSELLFKSKRQVVLGNPNGDVTLVEFFDYNCGYCKRAHADMKRLLDEDKNLRIVLKEFPVLGEGSVGAAQIGVAVNLIAPEKYTEFHDKLISSRGQVDGARALAVAEEIGLDPTRLKEMAQSDETKATITEVYDLAGKLQLTGTPSYVTPKEVVVGAVGYDSLKEKIGQARCGQPSC